MAMLLKLAHEVEGFICIKKMCEMTNVPHLKDKILSLFKSSAQRNQASAIALFSIVMKDDANVEEGLVNNAIDQMLRDFHVAPHDYDSAKYKRHNLKHLKIYLILFSYFLIFFFIIRSLLMGGDQEADVGER